MPGDLERHWSELERRWTDPKAHDAFIAACAEAERLDFAGQQYRQRQNAMPGDPVARQRLAQVLSSVMARLQPGQASDGAWGLRSYWRARDTVKLALCLAVLGFLGGTWLAEKVWPLPEGGTCGGLLLGSPACALADLLAALGNGLGFSVPLAGMAFFGTLFAARKVVGSH